MNPSKLGLKKFDVHFGTFEYTVCCIVGPYESAKKYARWKMDDPDIRFADTAPRGMCLTSEGWVPILWIPRAPRTAREYGSLAHEVLHAVTYMLNSWTNVRLTLDSDEVYCHAVGHLMTSILESLEVTRQVTRSKPSPRSGGAVVLSAP